MRCLVTGALGKIGSELVKRLNADPENDIYKLDLKTWEPTDIRDWGATYRVFRDFRPDIVFHLAALTGATGCGMFAEDYLDVNVRGTWNVLDSALAVGCRKAVVFSSASVYGFRDTEGNGYDAPSPRNAYGSSKLAMEALVPHFRNSGMKVAVIRPFTVFGGETTRPDSVFGLWKMGKGEVNGLSSRGFTHVDDLLDAVMTLVDRDEYPELPIDVSGERWKVGDIYKMLMPYLGGLTYSTVDQTASSSKSILMRSMGWKPQRSVIKWVRNEFNPEPKKEDKKKK